jgi:hypothetical protein
VFFYFWLSKFVVQYMQVGLTLQMDGNVVLSDMQNGVTVWQTNTTQAPLPSLIPNSLDIPTLTEVFSGLSTPPGAGN